MARPAARPCLNCIRVDLRLCEEFSSRDDALERVTDLSAKGMQHFLCDRSSGAYSVCYRGIPSGEGLLPRYEGQIIYGP